MIEIVLYVSRNSLGEFIWNNCRLCIANGENL